MVRLQHSLVDPSTGHSKRRLLPLYVRNTQVRPSPAISFFPHCAPPSPRSVTVNHTPSVPAV